VKRQRILRPAAAVLALLCACSRPHSGLDRLFPSPGFEKGWQWDGKPAHFTAQTLYEHIDGEAELYLGYGFQELASLVYFWDSPEDTFFVVDVYRLDSALNAFGLYSNLRHPEYRYQDIGVEAFVSDYGMKFQKGDCLVDIRAGNLSERCRRAVLVVATEIARRIPDSKRPPRELGLLPAGRQVPRSLRYVGKEMLNQGFLPGGMEARYALDEGEATGFVILFANPREARQGFDRFREYTAVSGRGFLAAKLPGDTAFVGVTAYHGTAMVFLAGTVIGGVQDCANVEQGMDLVQAIYASCTKPQGRP
jgi:hypothetical protein